MAQAKYIPPHLRGNHQHVQQMPFQQQQQMPFQQQQQQQQMPFQQQQKKQQQMPFQQQQKQQQKQRQQKQRRSQHQHYQQKQQSKCFRDIDVINQELSVIQKEMEKQGRIFKAIETKYYQKLGELYDEQLKGMELYWCSNCSVGAVNRVNCPEDLICQFCGGTLNQKRN